MSSPQITLMAQINFQDFESAKSGKSVAHKNGIPPDAVEAAKEMEQVVMQKRGGCVRELIDLYL